MISIIGHGSCRRDKTVVRTMLPMLIRKRRDYRNRNAGQLDPKRRCTHERRKLVQLSNNFDKEKQSVAEITYSTPCEKAKHGARQAECPHP